MALEALAILLLTTWDSRSVKPSSSFLAICWAWLVTFWPMIINFALVWASSCWQECFTIGGMNQIVIEHTFGAVLWAFLVALPAIEAFFASVALTAASAYTFWARSTILWALLCAPQAVPFAIASLAFSVLVRYPMLRVFSAVVLLASRRYVAIAAQIAPIRTPVFGTFQVTPVAPLELVLALAAMKALEPDLVFASTNI